MKKQLCGRNCENGITLCRLSPSQIIIRLIYSLAWVRSEDEFWPCIIGSWITSKLNTFQSSAVPKEQLIIRLKFWQLQKKKRTFPENSSTSGWYLMKWKVETEQLLSEIAFKNMDLYSNKPRKTFQDHNGSENFLHPLS